MYPYCRVDNTSERDTLLNMCLDWLCTWCLVMACCEEFELHVCIWDRVNLTYTCYALFKEMFSLGLCFCRDMIVLALRILAEPMVVPAWRAIVSNWTSA